MQNLEAKFKLPDLERARRTAESLGYQFMGVLRQHDVFFRVARGKLKLRQERSEKRAEATLIHYGREPSDDLKLSNYQIMRRGDPEQMREILAAALGTLAEVRKERALLTKQNVRLHLDAVDGLGSFGEIEAVLGENATLAASRDEVDELLDALGVRRANLIGVSYADMLRPV